MMTTSSTNEVQPVIEGIEEQNYHPQQEESYDYESGQDSGEDLSDNDQQPLHASTRRRRRTKPRDTEKDFDLQFNNDITYRHPFYAHSYPLIEEYVVCLVIEHGDMGFYVELLQYGNREGMGLMPETRRRGVITRVRERYAIGRKVVLQVIRVDQEKGYVDLSHRRVEELDEEEAMKKYHKQRVVHESVIVTAAELNIEVSLVYGSVIYPLQRLHGEDNVFDVLRAAISREEVDSQEVWKDVVIIDPMLAETFLNCFECVSLTTFI